jgi:hypothetical protein
MQGNAVPRTLQTGSGSLHSSPCIQNALNHGCKVTGIKVEVFSANIGYFLANNGAPRMPKPPRAKGPPRFICSEFDLVSLSLVGGCDGALSDRTPIAARVLIFFRGANSFGERTRSACCAVALSPR